MTAISSTRRDNATISPSTRKQRPASATTNRGLHNKWWLRALFVATAFMLSLPTLLVLPSSSSSHLSFFQGTLFRDVVAVADEESGIERRGLHVGGDLVYKAGNDTDTLSLISAKQYNPPRISKGKKIVVIDPLQGWPQSMKSDDDDEEEEEEENDDTHYFTEMPSPNWKKYNPNRTIAFVHVGKSGGLTLRQSTSLICRLGLKGLQSTEEEKQPCINKKFSADATLSRQTKFYFHMNAYRPQQMQQATSFLFVLRNPVERVISSFRYSHPANCKGVLETGQDSQLPHGCRIERQSKTRGKEAHRVWGQCYPSAAMEDFAQQTMGPFPPLSTSGLDAATSAHNETIRACRQTAREMVRGSRIQQSAPHMYYNLGYYKRKTLDLYPDKEVFGVRTDHEWDDIRDLDVAIGGGGRFLQKGRHVSHGSEHYVPSPLTTKAYHKLCCVLQEEIANYQEILQRVVNLKQTAKEECMAKVRESCGIDTSIQQWRRKCQAQMDKDDKEELKHELPEATGADKGLAKGLDVATLKRASDQLLANKMEKRKRIVGPSYRKAKPESLKELANAKAWELHKRLHQAANKRKLVNTATEKLQTRNEIAGQDLDTLSPAANLKIAKVLEARTQRRRDANAQLVHKANLRGKATQPQKGMPYRNTVHTDSAKAPTVERKDRDNLQNVKVKAPVQDAKAFKARAANPGIQNVQETLASVVKKKALDHSRINTKKPPQKGSNAISEKLSKTQV